MSNDRTKAQDIRAGAGVAGVLVVACACLWGWIAIRDRHENSYVVRFTAEQGAYGLAYRSPVHVGGLHRGHVESITPLIEHGEIVGYDALILLRGDVSLYRAARVESSGSSVSGDASIEIVDLGRRRSLSGVAEGDDERDPDRLPPGALILASEPVPYRAFVGLRGAPRLSALIESIRPLRASYGNIGDDLSAKTPAIRNDFTALRDQLRADYGTWQQHFTDARESALHAIASLGAGKDPAPDAVIPQFRAAAEDAKALKELNTQRVALSYGALSKAIDSINALGKQSDGFTEAVRDAEASLARSMADFSITGQELAAITPEVLAAPWKLFASPSAAQRAESRRVEEARIFAQAATEYRRALSGIQKALERDAKLLESAPGLAELLQTQTDAASRLFEASTARFVDSVLGPVPAPKAPPSSEPPAAR